MIPRMRKCTDMALLQVAQSFLRFPEKLLYYVHSNGCPIRVGSSSYFRSNFDWVEHHLQWGWCLTIAIVFKSWSQWLGIALSSFWRRDKPRCFGKIYWAFTHRFVVEFTPLNLKWLSIAMFFARFNSPSNLIVTTLKTHWKRLFNAELPIRLDFWTFCTVILRITQHLVTV